MTAVAPSVRERTAGWFPSRWGPDDQAGALNEITPAVVLDAVRLTRSIRPVTSADRTSPFGSGVLMCTGAGRRRSA